MYEEEASTVIPVKRERLSTSDDVGEDSDKNDSTLALSKSEAKAFGKTIGKQLKELSPTQRFVAEKLISEVIFFGKMEKLENNSCISLKGEVIDSDE